MWAGKEGVFQSRASLRIYGGGLTPEEVTTALKIQPTRTSVNNENLGMWTYSTKDHVNNLLPLAAHLKHLIDLLSPNRDSLILLQKNFSTDVLCYFASQSDTGGFDLPAAVLADLATLNLGLRTDEYFCCR
jgi:hypothetical protein